MDIPRNFLVTLIRSPEIPTIIFVMSLPDLHGVEHKSLEMYTSLMSHAGWWWSVAPENVVMAYTEGAISTTRKFLNAPSVARAQKNANGTTYFGLIKQTGDMFNSEEFVFISKDGADDVVITCDGLFRGKCESLFDIRPGLVMKYIFDKRQLHDWKNIDNRIIDLFSSFISK